MSHEDALEQRVSQLLDAPMSRGALKRAASALDAESELRAAVVSEAARRGNAVPESLPGWSGKRLLRWARGRSEQAQIRSNPIARDEPFTCAHCERDVPPHGRTARDHCPHCLRSLHVDVVPGDRAANCGGILEPVRAEAIGGDAWRLHYRCLRCGMERRNRVLRDGDPPDDWRLVVALTRGSP